MKRTATLICSIIEQTCQNGLNELLETTQNDYMVKVDSFQS